jgi:hypothetical protein
VSVCVVWKTDGATPLYIASQEGHDEVVRALVGAGAAVNRAAVRGDWGGCWFLAVHGRLLSISQQVRAGLCVCGVFVGCAWCR